MIFLFTVVFAFNFLFFASRCRHTRFSRDWSSDVCSSDLDSASAITRLLVPGESTLGSGPLRLGAEDDMVPPSASGAAGEDDRRRRWRLELLGGGFGPLSGHRGLAATTCSGRLDRAAASHERRHRPTD